MGAEQDAYQTVDGKGVPFAGGGVTAGLRDLGRLGMLMLNGGEINGERLFPAAVVETILRVEIVSAGTDEIQEDILLVEAGTGGVGARAGSE